MQVNFVEVLKIVGAGVLGVNVFVLGMSVFAYLRKSDESQNKGKGRDMLEAAKGKVK
jgi:hypothetical protein